MRVTILIEGRIESKHEKIEAALEVPDGWKPSWGELTKVKGVIRFLEEQMERGYTPAASNN